MTSRTKFILLNLVFWGWLVLSSAMQAYDAVTHADRTAAILAELDA
jgi:hypothetical protein